jgi:hypothetical protein
VIDAARAGEETAAIDALGTLLQTYWQPLYGYARRKGKPMRIPMGISGVVRRAKGRTRFYRIFTRVLQFFAIVDPVMRNIRTVGAPCFGRSCGGG